MSIASNRMYNNQAIGRAFSGLAQLFAPPSGSDLAGYASAAAKREEASRLAELFRAAQDPDTDWSTLDRLGIGAGVFSPNQSFEAVDRNNATQRYGYDRTYQASRENNADDNERALAANRADNERALATNSADNARALEQTRLGNTKDITVKMLDPVADGATRFVPPSIAGMYGVPETQVGAPKPLSETEWRAQQNERLLQSGALSDQMLIDTILGDKTPVEAIGTDGKARFMAPGEAVRTGATPYDRPSAEKVDNYLAVGANGEEKRFVGYVGPDSRIYDVETRMPVDRVVRKESTGGGMSFETDGQGGIRLSTGNAAGNTTARTTDLQRQEAEAGRAVAELTSLFETLRPDDLGAAGNINDVLTNYGAQVFPTLARPDVASTRAQLRATTLGLARALVQDERLSDADRRAANEVTVSDGLGESLPGAQAKLASLIALNAYRQKFANTIRTGGEKLPPLNGAMLGRLVDEEAISPRVAEVYAKNVLRHAPQATGELVPGVVNPGNQLKPSQPQPGATGAPQPGTIEDGYRFLGGDPTKPASWERVQ